MTLGSLANVSDDDSIISQGDSAELRANIYDDEFLSIVADDIDSVEFAIQKPDGDQSSFAGIIEDDGTGFYRYLGTDVLGKFLWVARFTLVSGQIRSRRGQFFVVDPFQQIIPDSYQDVAEAVWMRLEDCFDSQEGGPWLKDVTMAYFDKEKIPRFVNEGLLLINMTNPITEFDADYFFTPIDPTSTEIVQNYKNDPQSFILVEATLIATIKHLMRSYVEQPDLVGANVVRETRRDYLQRWGTILQIEQDQFKTLLGLWKRQFLNYGHGKLLVASKAGRLATPGARTRNVGRGGWY